VRPVMLMHTAIQHPMAVSLPASLHKLRESVDLDASGLQDGVILKVCMTYLMILRKDLLLLLHSMTVVLEQYRQVPIYADLE